MSQFIPKIPLNFKARKFYVKGYCYPHDQPRIWTTAFRQLPVIIYPTYSQLPSMYEGRLPPPVRNTKASRAAVTSGSANTCLNN
jgi:hypothetical protein